MNKELKEMAIMNGDDFEKKYEIVDKRCEELYAEIKGLQAENEKLKAKLDRQQTENDEATEKAFAQMCDECVFQKERCNGMCEANINLKHALEKLATVRAEAIDEFAEKVKDKMPVFYHSAILDIEQIAKELKEGK